MEDFWAHLVANELGTIDCVAVLQTCKFLYSLVMQMPGRKHLEVICDSMGEILPRQIPNQKFIDYVLVINGDCVIIKPTEFMKKVKKIIRAQQSLLPYNFCEMCERWFPKLEKVEFLYSSFNNTDTNLFMNQLQELYIFRYSKSSLHRLQIKSNTLRRISFIKSGSYGRQEIKVIAPFLEFLDLTDSYANQFMFIGPHLHLHTIITNRVGSFVNLNNCPNLSYLSIARNTELVNSPPATTFIDFVD